MWTILKMIGTAIARETGRIILLAYSTKTSHVNKLRHFLKEYYILENIKQIIYNKYHNLIARLFFTNM